MFGSDWKLKKRVEDLEDTSLALKKSLTTMEVQWLDTLDRLKRMMQRILKERQRTEEAEGESDSASPTPTLPEGSGLDPISQRILTRRSRIAHPGGTQ